MAHELKKKWRSSDIQLEEKISFSVLIQNKQVLKGLKTAGFQRPSPVQAKAIPIARLGVDMFVQAKSGTGKTLVFSIAILERLKNNPKLQTLVIVPTREIAVQVLEVIYDISSGFPGLRCHTFIGGCPLDYDIENVNDCQIAVGTPGRIRHLIENKNMPTSCIRTLVLDEADKLCGENARMSAEVQSILRHLPTSKQIIAVSATYENDAFENIQAYMKSPRFVNMSMNELALQGVTQYFHAVEVEETDDFSNKLKFDVLKNILCSVSFSQCLIFCRFVKIVQSFCSELVKWNFPASAITGTDEQPVRLYVMEKLKTHRIKILVSSDLTSRGIDAENVDLVIHLDPGKDLETYLHRVGRAGRYGSKGVSVAIISNESELMKLASYKNRAGLSIYPLPNNLPRCLNQYIPSDKDEDAIFECIKSDIEFKGDTHSTSTQEDISPKDSDTENGDKALDDVISNDSEEEPGVNGNHQLNKELKSNNFSIKQQANVSCHNDYSSDEECVSHGNNKVETDEMDFPIDHDEICSSDSEILLETENVETNSLIVKDCDSKNDVLKSEMQNHSDHELSIDHCLSETPRNISSTSVIEKTNIQSDTMNNSEDSQQLKILGNCSDFGTENAKSLIKNSLHYNCSQKSLQGQNTELLANDQESSQQEQKSKKELETSIEGNLNAISDQNNNKCKDDKIEKVVKKKTTIFSKPPENDPFLHSSGKNEYMKLKDNIEGNVALNSVNPNDKSKRNKFSDDIKVNFNQGLRKSKPGNKLHSSAKKFLPSSHKQEWKSPSFLEIHDDCPLTRTTALPRSSKSHQKLNFSNGGSRNDESKSYEYPNQDSRKSDLKNMKPYKTQSNGNKGDGIQYAFPLQCSKKHSYEYKRNSYSNYSKENIKLSTHEPTQPTLMKRRSDCKHRQHHRSYSSYITTDNCEVEQPSYNSTKHSFMKHKYEHKHHRQSNSYPDIRSNDDDSEAEGAIYNPVNHSFEHYQLNYHDHRPNSSTRYENSKYGNSRPHHRHRHDATYSKPSHHVYAHEPVKVCCPFCRRQVCCKQYADMTLLAMSHSSVFHKNDYSFRDGDVSNPVKSLLYPFKFYPPSFSSKYDGYVDYGKYLHDMYLSSRK